MHLRLYLNIHSTVIGSKMSRPKPNIIMSKTMADGITWDIIPSDSQYTILYKGQVCAIRKSTGWTTPGFKYLKSTYPNEGSVIAQVNRLNKKFDCTDFSYALVA